MLKKLYVIFLLVAGLSFGTDVYAQSVQDNGQQKIMRTYPNPASSNINFDFQRNFKPGYTLAIFNFIGKKVYEVKNVPSRINILLNEFYRGIYVYQLRDQAGAIVESGKFQVVK